MADVVLSFAGWSPVNGKAHRAIARLQPGDPLSLVRDNGQWKILDQAGNQVGRMARKWSPPAGMAVDRAAVQGIFTRWAKEEANDERRQAASLRDLGSRRARAPASAQATTGPACQR